MTSQRTVPVLLLAALALTLGFPPAVKAADEVPAANGAGGPTELPTELTLDTHAYAAKPLYAQADVPQDREDRWWTSLSIVAWLPTFDGTLTVDGQEGESSGDVADSLDFFDTYVDWGIDVHAEFGQGRLGYLFDGLYVDIHSDRETSGGDTFRIVTSGFVGEAGVFYTVLGEPIGVRARRGLRIDVLGGGRLGVLSVGIESDALDDPREHETKLDPFGGGRAELGLTDWLSLKARGDIGGFGIADITSDFVWSANLAAAFHFGERFDLELGYHWLDYDFESDDDDTSYNASIAGPYLAVTFWL